MGNVVCVLPKHLQADGNQLACAVGASMDDLKTFDICPRVLGAGNSIWLWVNAQVSDSFWQHLSQPLTLPDYDDGTIDLSAAQSLLNAALILTPDMLAEDYQLPDISNRLVIGPNMDPQTVLSALKLIPINEE